MFLLKMSRLFWSTLEVNSPCNRITLRAEKALRVILLTLGGEALSRAEPPAGPPKITKSLGEITFPKIRENSKFHENLDFVESCKNLFVSTTFSQTHRQTQRIHSWIALDLRKGGKLLRSQLNSQILRYLHFSEPFTPLFDKPS